MVGGHFEEVAGVRKAVDLVEDDPAAGVGLKESLGILGIAAGGWEFAVHENRFRNRAREGGLPDAPRGGEPNDRALAPGFFNEVEPDWTGNHARSFCV